MKMESLPAWGQKLNLDQSWTLSQLDSLAFAQFLADYLPGTYFQNEAQFTDYLTQGDAQVWESQQLLGMLLYEAKLNRKHKFFQPQVLKNVIPEAELTDLRAYINKILNIPDLLIWCDGFNRYQLFNSPYLEVLHKKMLPFAETQLQKKLKPTYAFLSLYKEKGYCRPHVDDNKCEWTLDVCINQDQVWPLFIENKPFLLEENHGLIYSGTDQVHWRRRIHENGFCHLIFFHFEEI